MFLFIVFALIAIVAALGVILSHKPVYSALFLLMNFGTLAALYIMLQAQFLAAVQVIVYAGAIVVLILFVVMLIGGGELRNGDRRTRGPGDTATAVPASPGRRVALGWPRITAIVLAVMLTDRSRAMASLPDNLHRSKALRRHLTPVASKRSARCFTPTTCCRSSSPRSCCWWR